MKLLLYNPFKSVTIWGVFGAIIPLLANAFDPGGLSPTVSTLLQALGVLVGALGLRNAHAKAVAEMADLVTQLAAKK